MFIYQNEIFLRMKIRTKNSIYNIFFVRNSRYRLNMKPELFSPKGDIDNDDNECGAIL